MTNKVLLSNTATLTTSALKAINHVLRDHRNGEVHDIDPRLLDLLADRVNKFAHAGAGNRRDRKELSFILTRPSAQIFDALRFIERVNLGRHHNLRTRTELGIIRSQLAIDDLVIRYRITPGD